MTTTPDPRAAYLIARQLLVDEIREHGHAVTGSYVGRQALVLTTVGARSGESRSTPVAYSRDGERFVITATKGGADEHPGWYHNLVADPVVTVEVDKRRFQARASAADGAERERLWARHIEIHASIGEYSKRTTRVIPVLVLEPLP